MTYEDELYSLYKSDPDFKEYVDKMSKARKLNIDEVLKLNVLQQYALYLKNNKGDKV
jgi:hypothetical protein